MYREALPLAEQANDYQGQSMIFHALGRICERSDRKAEALEFYQRNLDVLLRFPKKGSQRYVEISQNAIRRLGGDAGAEVPSAPGVTAAPPASMGAPSSAADSAGGELRVRIEPAKDNGKWLVLVAGPPDFFDKLKVELPDLWHSRQFETRTPGYSYGAFVRIPGSMTPEPIAAFARSSAASVEIVDALAAPPATAGAVGLGPPPQQPPPPSIQPPAQTPPQQPPPPWGK